MEKLQVLQSVSSISREKIHEVIIAFLKSLLQRLRCWRYHDVKTMAKWQSLTKVVVLPVIRSGFYEDRQKYTLCRSECPTQFSPILSKYFLLPSQACLECSQGQLFFANNLTSYHTVVLETGRGWPPFDQESRL